VIPEDPSEIEWPDRWQPEAVDAVSPHLGSDEQAEAHAELLGQLIRASRVHGDGF
jgi:hypothetical protein